MSGSCVCVSCLRRNAAVCVLNSELFDEISTAQRAFHQACYSSSVCRYVPDLKSVLRALISVRKMCVCVCLFVSVQFYFTDGISFLMVQLLPVDANVPLFCKALKGKRGAMTIKTSVLELSRCEMSVSQSFFQALTGPCFIFKKKGFGWISLLLDEAALQQLLTHCLFTSFQSSSYTLPLSGYTAFFHNSGFASLFSIELDGECDQTSVKE